MTLLELAPTVIIRARRRPLGECTKDGANAEQVHNSSKNAPGARSDRVFRSWFDAEERWSAARGTSLCLFARIATRNAHHNVRLASAHKVPANGSDGRRYSRGLESKWHTHQINIDG